MYTLKEAIVTRERFHEDIETSVFYMDMRTYGKDYEAYLERARTDYGVRLVRSRPHSVEPVLEDGAPNGNLVIAYSPYATGHLESEVFDMVVLAIGFRPSAEIRALAGSLGVELNEHGFAKTGSFEPVATSRPGVFACGMCHP